MKTTVEIADGLLEEAKRLARERDLTLRELIECGLRKELRERRRPAKRVAVLHEPYGDPQGTWPLAPYSDDDWGSIREASYERDDGE